MSSCWTYIPIEKVGLMSDNFKTALSDPVQLKYCPDVWVPKQALFGIYELLSDMIRAAKAGDVDRALAFSDMAAAAIKPDHVITYPPVIKILQDAHLIDNVTVDNTPIMAALTRSIVTASVRADEVGWTLLPISEIIAIPPGTFP
jgi:hypothetical protein